MSTKRSSNWSVTINNPTPADYEAIEIARQKGWKVLGQLEQGEFCGTPHLQLFVGTPQVRFSALKKAFPRAHIEIARNPAALQLYVAKEETRVAELPTTQEQYPSTRKVWEWFAEVLDEGEPSIDVQAREMFEENNNARARDVSVKYRSLEEIREALYLDCFDTMIGRKICEGYFVELIGVNPQIRSAVKKYGFYIHQRSRTFAEFEIPPLETDRQTDTRLENEESVSVEVTTVENADS